jgi:5'-3' exonuclease
MKQARQKDAYKQQTPYIEKALRFLGVAQLRAQNMEADDLAAILTDRYTAQGARITLYSGDKDWLQLVGPNVVWRDVVADRGERVVRLANFEEVTGCATPAQFVEVKALSGDSGDSVPGVGGIGKKGAIEFVQKYGTFREFLEGVSITKTIDFKALPKKYRDLVVDEEKAIAFQRNIDLMDLRAPVRPAPVGMRLDAGEPDAEKFRRLCELLLFNQFLKDFETWLRPFPHFNDYVETRHVQA